GIVSRSRLGVRRVLVIAEIALAMVLLVGAGLMINSYARLTSVDLGMDPDNVLTMDVNLFGMDRFRVRRAPNHWSAKPEISMFYTKALERLALVPGVESVAATSNLPPTQGRVLPFRIIGKPTAGDSDMPSAAYHEVSSSFFATMRIPVLRGRSFSDLDTEN